VECSAKVNENISTPGCALVLIRAGDVFTKLIGEIDRMNNVHHETQEQCSLS